MSQYVKLMEARKRALKRGKEEEAEKLFMAARKLASEGKVTSDEKLAAAYI
jgi:hypothetical protein